MKFFKKIKCKLGSFKRTVMSASCGRCDAIKIAFDLLYCKLRFHVNEDEYLKYNFYNLKNRYRKNFILIYHQKHYYVNISSRFFTRSKYILYKRIPDLFKRGIILVPHCGEEDFIEFVKKYKKVILKPDLGSLGRGIEIYTYTDEASLREYFKSFSKDTPFVCEEYIQQHHLLNEFNSSSVNSIRVVTLLDGNDVEIIAAVLKTGGSFDKIVDNLHNGGIGAQIDINTGIVTTAGHDYQFNSYTYHPVSGTQFMGFNVPNWEYITQLVKKAHLRLPQCLIFGWDIAITETGADIIEVNNAPGPLLMQTMDKIPKGEKAIKMMKTIKIPQKYSKTDIFIPDYSKNEY